MMPLKQIEDSGGSTVAPRTAIPGMGAFAYSRTRRATYSACGRTLLRVA